MCCRHRGSLATDASGTSARDRNHELWVYVKVLAFVVKESMQAEASRCSLILRMRLGKRNAVRTMTTQRQQLRHALHTNNIFSGNTCASRIEYRTADVSGSSNSCSVVRHFDSAVAYGIAQCPPLGLSAELGRRSSVSSSVPRVTVFAVPMDFVVA